MKKFVYALRGISRQNPRQLLLGRLLDILNAAEVLEQVGSALIAHARDFIQCGAAHLFAAQLAVILDGATRARVRWRSSLTMPKHGTDSPNESSTSLQTCT